jgi:hypothetical protein
MAETDVNHVQIKLFSLIRPIHQVYTDVLSMIVQVSNMYS